MRFLLLTAALAASTLLATAQNTPKGEEKQARADRKLDEAGKIKHGESISKKPKLVRERDKMDHHKKQKMSM